MAAITVRASSVTLALSHLFFAFGRRTGAGAGGLSGPGRMSAAARLGFELVHGDDLRHPLPIRLSCLGQARLELGGGPLRLRAGRLTQPLGAHHHPLRIAREHQQILRVRRRALGLRVERIDVLGG
jgi:hypothetical protein